MTTMIREPECVVLKRHGAKYVKKLIAGMSLEEQVEFWHKHTESMLERQRKSIQKQVIA